MTTNTMLKPKAKKQKKKKRYLQVRNGRVQLLKQKLMYLSEGLEKKISTEIKDRGLYFGTLVRSLYYLFVSFPEKIKADFIENNYLEIVKRYFRGRITKPVYFRPDDLPELNQNLNDWRLEYGVRISFIKLVVSLLHFYLDMTEEEKDKFIEKRYKVDEIFVSNVRKRGNQ